MAATMSSSIELLNAYYRTYSVNCHLSVGRVVAGETEGNNSIAVGGIRIVEPGYSNDCLVT